jgi:flagellar hook-basal body complex protein FliE
MASCYRGSRSEQKDYGSFLIHREDEPFYCCCTGTQTEKESFSEQFKLEMKEMSEKQEEARTEMEQRHIE